MELSEILKHLTWVLVVLSIGGNLFVIKKNVTGQWLWATSNVGWIAYFLYIGVYSSAFLFTVYLGLCVWGIISWTKDDKKAKAEVAA
jgi:nicotinamide riboside transporter PnuC